ncbi:MAG: DUF1850 domain-containing protein [Treponemataceae bacterium]
MLGFCLQRKNTYLDLIDFETKKKLTSFKFIDKPEFSISFIHSVNKTLVEEGYIIQDKKIYLEWTRYYSFGAGVATEVFGNQKLTMNEDGSMLITGFNQLMPNLTYAVSTIYDHSLTINNQTINLTDLGLKNKAVCFAVRK